eukprot:CAMPEP_0116137810 /NCGR_PEP_ID=MMETSP0329-20121206/12440_1 /TAXON_ID=697910 /ORGANISM="Pseudo-nitzschia arenysensis, Strain B593" /LENGTH=696 /DNA_ID=CAMNT_0003632737 /DNA_START=58 /DNA_END=2144 /DNA_ORIENTATION=+
MIQPSAESIEHSRLSPMMIAINEGPYSDEPTASNYSDQPVARNYSDNESDGDETDSFDDETTDAQAQGETNMRYFDIEGDDDDDDDDHSEHDQLPSVEEIRMNNIVDHFRQRRRMRKRIDLILLGLTLMGVLIGSIHFKRKRDRYVAAVEAVTVTIAISDKDDFLAEFSPQAEAITWMIEKDSHPLPLPTLVSDPFVQRYLAAVLVFSITNPNSKTFDMPQTLNTRKAFNLLSNDHECNWNSKWTREGDDSNEVVGLGILCDNDEDYITEIRLPKAGIGKDLPPELKYFFNLRTLDLSNGKIGGTIPPLPLSLRDLNLSHNLFTESFPTQFSELYHLSSLRLSHNLLKGSIPKMFGALTQLQYLDLEQNHLSGGLEMMDALVNLEELYLANNELDYELSHFSLRELSHLRVLDAKGNRLSGHIPSALWKFLQLQVIDLSYNSLDGHMSDDTNIAKGHPLKYLDLSHNLLGGGLPTSIRNLDFLTHLDVSYNRFGSRIPKDDLVALTNLKTLLLTEDDDMGPGPLPDWLRGMTDLRHLSFRLATRTGTIPAWFGELTNLELLDLDWNHLSGSIPTELGFLANLKYLMLNRNLLTGTVPTQVSYLPNLKILMLDTNSFTDEILVGDEHICQAGEKGRISHLIADCGRVDCPCCTDCCDPMMERCNMKDWTLEVKQGIHNMEQAIPRYERESDASFVPV